MARESLAAAWASGERMTADRAAIERMPGNAAVAAGETVKAATAGVEPTTAVETTAATAVKTTAAAVSATTTTTAATATGHRIGCHAYGADGYACEQRESDFG